MIRLPKLKEHHRKYFGGSIYFYYSYEQNRFTNDFENDFKLLKKMYGDKITTTDFDDSLDWCAIVFDK